MARVEPELLPVAQALPEPLAVGPTVRQQVLPRDLPPEKRSGFHGPGFLVGCSPDKKRKRNTKHPIFIFRGPSVLDFVSDKKYVFPLVRLFVFSRPAGGLKSRLFGPTKQATKTYLD